MHVQADWNLYIAFRWERQSIKVQNSQDAVEAVESLCCSDTNHGAKTGVLASLLVLVWTPYGARKSPVKHVNSKWQWIGQTTQRRLKHIITDKSSPGAACMSSLSTLIIRLLIDHYTEPVSHVFVGRADMRHSGDIKVPREDKFMLGSFDMLTTKAANEKAWVITSAASERCGMRRLSISTV